MAAVTERIRFLTNVVKLPIRDPLLVAKQLSSMAVLSNDRVGLGVGLSAGSPKSSRGRTPT